MEKIITLNKSNIDKEHICCAISDIKCKDGYGFEKSHRVKNFFTDNYDHPMFDGDIQLIDMIYLKKDL